MMSSGEPTDEGVITCDGLRGWKSGSYSNSGAWQFMVTLGGMGLLDAISAVYCEFTSFLGRRQHMRYCGSSTSTVLLMCRPLLSTA